MTTKRYDALLLDVDDTLLDFRACEREALEAVFRWLGRPLDNDTALLYSRGNQELWDEHERGRVSRDELVVLRFARLFRRLGVSADGGEANRVFLEALGGAIHMVDGALEVCQTLSRDFALYVVTNGVLHSQKRRLADSGLAPLMRGIFISEEVGRQKPDPAFFDEVFRRMGRADRSRTLIVGDSLSADIQGGYNAGIDTCWLNHRGKEGRPGLVPTFQIASLYELEGILYD